MANYLNSKKLSSIDIFSIASTIDTKCSLLPLIAPKKSTRRMQVRKVNGRKELGCISRDPLGSSKDLKFNSRTERHKIIFSEKWKKPYVNSSSRYSTFIKCKLGCSRGNNVKTNKSMNEIIKKIEMLRSQPCNNEDKFLQVKKEQVKEQVFPSLSKAKASNLSLIQQSKENCDGRGDTCYNFIRLMKKLNNKHSGKIVVLKEKKNRELSLIDSSDCLNTLLCQKYS